MNNPVLYFCNCNCYLTIQIRLIIALASVASEDPIYTKWLPKTLWVLQSDCSILVQFFSSLLSSSLWTQINYYNLFCSFCSPKFLNLPRRNCLLCQPMSTIVLEILPIFMTPPTSKEHPTSSLIHCVKIFWTN